MIAWVLCLTVDRFDVVAWEALVARTDTPGIPHLDRKTTSLRGSAQSERVPINLAR